MKMMSSPAFSSSSLIRHVRGTYEPKASYTHGDIVAHNGASWIARRDDPGELPGPGWQLLAAQGKRGNAGERGLQGPAAPQLADGGSLSFSPSQGVMLQTRMSTGGPGPRISLFKSIQVDAQSFELRFIGSDDATLSINLRPLFEEYQRQTEG